MEIENELYKAQRAKFPKDNFLAFTPEYCLSLDGKQNIFQGYLKIPTEMKDKPFSEIVILSSNFMLERLSEAEEWFLDGTFWAAPENFRQILNIVIYNQRMDKYICAAHILLSSKEAKEYEYALGNFLQKAKINNYKLQPKVIMSDFEKSLRKAISSVFVGTKLLGCQFHFVKALWRRAEKLGLRNKAKKIKTSRVITILTFLVHVDGPKRREYFDEIRELLKNEEKSIRALLDYFSKNWLQSSFIDVSENRERFERTNNCCEGFNSYLSIL